MRRYFRRRRGIWPLGILLAGAVVLAVGLLPAAGSAVVLTAPTNTSEPRIIGQAMEGKTLTANPGTWSGTTPIHYDYRWVRCPTDGGAPDGSNCGFIPNATNSSYRLRDADVGLRIRVRVTATNGDGAATRGIERDAGRQRLGAAAERSAADNHGLTGRRSDADG